MRILLKRRLSSVAVLILIISLAACSAQGTINNGSKATADGGKVAAKNTIAPTPNTEIEVQFPEPNDEPVYTKYIINNVVEHPDFQYLPMPSIQLKMYGFSTEGFTPFNWVITGYFTDNPKDGLIINYNLHSNLDSVNPRYIHRIPNVGKITLTGINEDKTKLFFKTENGKTGEFDVTSKTGSYKIN